MKKRILVVIGFSLSLIFYFSVFSPSIAKDKVSTIYGGLEITEPVLIDVLHDPTMLRLKKIHQYGLDYYTYKPEEYNRFDHSVGVFFLARRYGAGLDEQVASLLHDVSHTAFSHVADFLYRDADGKNSYQDDIHESYISKSSLKNVLEKHGLTVADILNKNEEFKILEADCPDLCADRLEYNLAGALFEGITTKHEIADILNHLHFADNRWFFDDSKYARKFADFTLYLTLNKWAQPDCMMRNIFGSRLLRYAVDKGYITHEQIHNGIDDDIWHLLVSVNDAKINQEIAHLKNPSAYYIISNSEDYDVVLKPKMRIVDPWVKVGDTFARLSSLDAEFQDTLLRIKKRFAQNYFVKLI